MKHFTTYCCSILLSKHPFLYCHPIHFTSFNAKDVQIVKQQRVRVSLYNDEQRRVNNLIGTMYLENPFLVFSLQNTLEGSSEFTRISSHSGFYGEVLACGLIFITSSLGFSNPCLERRLPQCSVLLHGNGGNRVTSGIWP